jgi:hypothetical protein
MATVASQKARKNDRVSAPARIYRWTIAMAEPHPSARPHALLDISSFGGSFRANIGTPCANAVSYSVQPTFVR